MTETPAQEPVDYRDTVFLPKTDFPMKAGLPQKEPGILARWQEMGIYERLRERRRGREKFILHDGPPYANGDMHIGHALNHILKDMVVRTQTLLGKDAPYVPGWDCHGLPIEWKVEEAYRKKKLNKDEVPVKEFRAECRTYAKGWVDVQREQLKRLGINGDWDNPYLTMDFDAEATIVTELMKFAESGQLYRGAKPVMWSPVEKTALAEAEVEYEDITSTQIDVAFEIVSSPIAELVGAYAVIWTTTPWTIPVNQAIAYGPDIDYVLVKTSPVLLGGDSDEAKAIARNWHPKSFLVAKPLMETLAERIWHSVGFNLALDVRWTGKGSDLAGTMARHPMWHLENPPRDEEGNREAVEGGVHLDHGTSGAPPPSAVPAATSPFRGGFFSKPRPFLPGDFVTTDTGTGLVHMSPDHGEDDFDLCKANGIDPVFAVQGDGKYRDDWGWLGGQGSVINPKFNAPDGPICSDLRESGGLLAASYDYKHSYPHSWRSKAKVIYRCTPQWFVPMDRPLAPPPPASQAVPLPETSSGRINEDKSSPSLLGEVAGALATDGGATLRSTALTAIAQTRWIPEKGQNRIRSMVEGRPDWVLSRQRAWGVPITLFVDRKTGHYLCDPAVNARIIAGVKAHGVDAWCDERAQEYLGADYNAHDYERVIDILDVWFDSGCTHAFVLESGKWPDLVRPKDYQDSPADLYLEGSDQHRGWFQSSLLESCGTRGRAPYKAVLTHGFTMDAKGMKMSKSLGNTINPIDLLRDTGADILRLWALTVDFTEDHRIGPEILQGVSDQYRKLRNTFRYLLGALDGFDEGERVAASDMPELERYMLHLLADMDAKLRGSVDDFDFNTYIRLITDFANNELSAFYFDIRKDCLYCDAATSPKRRAYRTVLDILFHALVRYMAPVMVFTAEEVWQTRYPDAGESVHFLDWPEVDAGWKTTGLENLGNTWERVREIRSLVTANVEPLRRDKIIGSSLEARVELFYAQSYDLESRREAEISELCIVSEVSKTEVKQTRHGEVGGVSQFFPQHPVDAIPSELLPGISVRITKTTNHKCGRCWRHLPEVEADGTLCNRCDGVVNA